MAPTAAFLQRPQAVLIVYKARLLPSRADSGAEGGGGGRGDIEVDEGDEVDDVKGDDSADDGDDVKTDDYDDNDNDDYDDDIINAVHNTMMIMM